MARGWPNAPGRKKQLAVAEARRAVQCQKCMKLRIRYGLSEQDIANRLGVSKRTVARRLAEGLQEAISEYAQDGEHWRQQLVIRHLERYKMAAAGFQRSTRPEEGGEDGAEASGRKPGDPRFLIVMGNALEQVAKLTGANAPEQVDVTVMDPLKALESYESQRATIIDAEVVEPTKTRAIAHNPEREEGEDDGPGT